MAGAVFVADRRLYLDAAREKVVEEGDPAAAFLFVAPGHPITVEQQEAYNLSHDGKVVVLGKAKKSPATKEAAKPEDK